MEMDKGVKWRYRMFENIKMGMRKLMHGVLNRREYRDCGRYLYNDRKSGTFAVRSWVLPKGGQRSLYKDAIRKEESEKHQRRNSVLNKNGLLRNLWHSRSTVLFRVSDVLISNDTTSIRQKVCKYGLRTCSRLPHDASYPIHVVTLFNLFQFDQN